MENAENKVEINEKTTVPLFNAIVAIVVLAGGIFWLSAVAAAAFSSEKRLDKIEDVIFKMKDDISYLKTREELREKLNK